MVPAARKRVILYCALAVALMVVSITIPLLNIGDPVTQALPDRLKPPHSALSGGRVAWLGTDQLGRDILSRLIYGSRVSLAVGAATVLFAGITGTLAGVVSGYYGGLADAVIVCLIDVQLAFPSILLAITLAAVLGPSLRNVVLTLSLTTWVVYARVARSVVIGLREKEYIEAARACGAGDIRILTKHVLPNILAPLTIVATLQLGQAILAESSLSFLGLGVPVDVPSWGGMVSDGRVYLHNAWWIATFPGLAIAFTVLVFGLLGDALRDYLDPRLKQ